MEKTKSDANLIITLGNQNSTSSGSSSSNSSSSVSKSTSSSSSSTGLERKKDKIKEIAKGIKNEKEGKKRKNKIFL